MLHVEPKKLHPALVPGRKTKGLTAIASKPWKCGSPTWIRTRDLRINSPSLYRLSYQGIVV